MKFALVENKRLEAFPKGKGLCICCNNETIAKCGSKRIKHWAHKNLKHCDNWWENETEWHRQWKSYFPADWQEVVHFDTITGEKHIADVKTDKGFVIELQNSPISFEEMQSRETFYKKMLWIINGKKFQNNFFFLGKLPDPKEKLFEDIAFMSTKRDDLGRSFFRYSENPDYKIKSNKLLLVLMHPYSDIEMDVENSYIGHRLFDWIHPRDVWFQAKCDVFIDFGEEIIWKLMKYGKGGLMCVLKIDKNYFIHRALGKIAKPNI
jgi:competence protein CoiA